MEKILPTLDAAKQQAKRLKTSLCDIGQSVSHSQALELTAHNLGFKDWNTLHAAIGNRPAALELAIGNRVSGRYLGQQFTGTIIAVGQTLTPGRSRVTLRLDEPVDVVTFDSFSAFRQRISVTLNEDGQTTEKTSNGQPQMVLDRKSTPR